MVTVNPLASDTTSPAVVTVVVRVPTVALSARVVRRRLRRALTVVLSAVIPAPGFAVVAPCTKCVKAPCHDAEIRLTRLSTLGGSTCVITGGGGSGRSP
jgi:hypothetical protein